MLKYAILRNLNLGGKVLILLTVLITLVYCQWYVSEEKQQTTTSIDTEDASKPIPATSPIQCILKCQRKWMDGFFVEERNECFCVLKEDDVLLSNEDGEDLAGKFYKENEV